MSNKKLKHDPYCWKCCKEKTTKHCTMCERSFHVNCIDIEPESIGCVSDKDWMCPVCVTIKSATIVDKRKGLQMLAIIMERVYNDPMYVDFRTMSKKTKGRTDDVIIVKPMNLNILKEKTAKYRNYEQFLADVKWMVHNCVILCSESHEKSQMAKILLDYFIDEIESVKKCAECYANATKHSDTWFTLACNEPHLLIWAKQKGFNYWPAKLMSIDGVLINVRFFGDHTHADIPATNCYLYSKTQPGRMKHTSNIFASALKEADKYIANIREKFGTFNLVEDRVVIDPAKYETYMAEAFPDLAQYRQAQIDEAEHIVEMEHIELPMNYIDPILEHDTDGIENLIDAESYSSRDDMTSDQVSSSSNRSNSEVFVKLTRIDRTLGEQVALSADHGKKYKNNEIDEASNAVNDVEEMDSIKNNDEAIECIENDSDTDSNAVQQMVIANHENDDTEKITNVKESDHQHQSEAATENGVPENGTSSTEIEQPAEKRARLMENDGVNGRPWPTMAARKADNGNQTDADDIESIKTSSPPPPSPHQSPEIDSSNPSKMVTSKMFTDLSSVLMEPIKQGFFHAIQKHVDELMDQNKTMERDLKNAVAANEDIDRKLKRAMDEIAEANNQIVMLKKQFDAKGACDSCGKSINAVYFCDVICRTKYFNLLLENRADVSQRKDQMDTNSTN